MPTDLTGQHAPIPLVDQLRDRMGRSDDDDVKLMTVLRTLATFVDIVGEGSVGCTEIEGALRDAGLPQWLEDLARRVEDYQQLWTELKAATSDE